MDKQSETEDDIDNEENNEEQVNHISEGQNENSQSNCFINKKAAFEDLIFAENQDKNNPDIVGNKDINNLSVSEGKIVFKNCKIGAIFQSHPFSNTLDSKKDEKDDQTLSKVKEKEKSMTIIKENENILKDGNYLQEIRHEQGINNKNDNINKEITTNNIYPEIIQQSEYKELKLIMELEKGSIKEFKESNLALDKLTSFSGKEYFQKLPPALKVICDVLAERPPHC